MTESTNLRSLLGADAEPRLAALKRDFPAQFEQLRARETRVHVSGWVLGLCLVCAKNFRASPLPVSKNCRGIRHA